MERTAQDFEDGGFKLTSAEIAKLESQKQSFMVNKEGKLLANNATVDGYFWELGFGEGGSTYDADSGAEFILLERTNTGHENVKIGGGTFVGIRFEDDDGVTGAGSYLKWADMSESEDGAYGIATMGALLVATVAALF